MFFLLLIRRKAVNTSEKYTVTCSPVTFDVLYMKLLKSLEWLFISVLVYVVLDNLPPRTYKAIWR